jgi:hypothetical protein
LFDKDLEGIGFIVSGFHDSLHDIRGSKTQFLQGLSVFLGQRTMIPEYVDNPIHGSFEHKAGDDEKSDSDTREKDRYDEPIA